MKCGVNKKIKNACPKEFNGVLYRSTLEARVARYLTEHNIEFKYEPFRITLLDSIRYDNKLFRAVHYTPDFICKDYIIEVKGFPNDQWALKKKLIIHLINEGKINYRFREVHNIRELESVINELTRD